MKLVVSVAGERIGVASLGKPGTYCVGRHGGSSLHLLHPTVSAQHATLHWDGEQLEVADRTDGARSWLDDEVLAGRAAWRPGQSLRLGAVALEMLQDPDADGLFAVGLTPSQGPLEPDASLADTMPLVALQPTHRPAWAPKLAVSAASVAAVAAAWVALFW